MRKLLLLLSLFTAPMFAGPYYGVTTSTPTGTALMNLSGKFCIAVSSVSSTTCITYFNDPTNGNVLKGSTAFTTANDNVGINILEAADGTAHMAIGATGPFDDFKLLTVGTTRSVSTTTAKNIHEFAQSSAVKVTISSGGINMLDNSAITFADRTSMTSTSVFVAKAGDTMTGPLTLSGSSLTVSGNLGVGGISSLTGLVATGSTITVGAGLYIAPSAQEFPSSTYDAYGLIMKTAGGGSAPFDQAGSLVYRARKSDTAGRGSHIFYTGATALERMRINEDGNVGIGTTAPARKLGALSGDSAVARFTSGAAQSFLEFYDSTNTYKGYVGTCGNALCIVGKSNYGAILYANDGTALYAYGDANKNVAVGTTTYASTSAHSKLTVYGPISTVYRIVTTTTTLDGTYSQVEGNTTSTQFTITLPTAVGIAGREYTIFRTIGTSNNLIIACNGAETINGDATVTITDPATAVTVVSNGTIWRRK